MDANPVRSGFGYLELVIVVAILLILMALLLPVYLPSRKVDSQPRCLNNQRQIIVAVHTWAADHQNQLPAADAVWYSLRVQRGTLFCPLTLVRRQISNSYCYNAALAGQTLDTFTDPTKALATSDGETTTPGGLPNISYGLRDIAWRHDNHAFASFLDGHVELVNPPGDAGWFTPAIKQ